MDRRDWYFEQRVTDAEWDEADDKIELADWAIAKEILGYGLLGSPLPYPASPADLTVNIPVHVGYDQLGRRIPTDAITNVNCAVDENAASTAVVAPGNEKWLSIFVEADRVLSDPRTDGNGSTVYWKRDETTKFNVVQSAEAGIGAAIKPPPRANQVLICDIYLIYGQTQILAGDINVLRREDFLYIELTPSYVASQLGFLGRAYQPTNVIIPAGSSVDVSTELNAHASPPGGSSTSKGIMTTPPDNYVKVFNIDRDNFIDPATGDKVYGRITATGATFPYTWTLTFYTYPAGGPEAVFDMTPFSGGPVFLWYVQEVFGLDSYPTSDPMFAIQSDQIAGEIPDATTTVKGKVQLATDGETAAGKAVQGSDSRLLPLNALASVRKLASRPSMIFMPRDDTPFIRYRLHQMHGLARGDYQNPTQKYGDYYFDYDRGHPDYPLDVYFNGSPAANNIGQADNTQPTYGLDTWRYVYLIGREYTGISPHLALVFSSNPPWAGGPALTDGGSPVFKFWNGGVVAGDEGGWRYWRFIAAVMNQNGSAWELCQIRKIGNHCEYELAQLQYTYGAIGALGWGTAVQSLATRVPPGSLRAFLRIKVTIASSWIHGYVRPAPTGNMALHETPGAGTNEDNKIEAHAMDWAGTAPAPGVGSGWVAMNEARQIDISKDNNGAGTDHSIFIYVLGYEEFADVDNDELVWP